MEDNQNIVVYCGRKFHQQFEAALHKAQIKELFGDILDKKLLNRKQTQAYLKYLKFKYKR